MEFAGVPMGGPFENRRRIAYDSTVAQFVPGDPARNSSVVTDLKPFILSPIALFLASGGRRCVQRQRAGAGRICNRRG